MNRGELVPRNSQGLTDPFEIIARHDKYRKERSPWAAQSYLELVAEDLGVDVQQLNTWLAQTRKDYYKVQDAVERFVAGGIDG